MWINAQNLNNINYIFIFFIKVVHLPVVSILVYKRYYKPEILGLDWYKTDHSYFILNIIVLCNTNFMVVTKIYSILYSKYLFTPTFKCCSQKVKKSLYYIQFVYTD